MILPLTAILMVLLSPPQSVTGAVVLRGTAESVPITDSPDDHDEDSSPITMEPTACATLQIYGKDQSCKGEPVKKEPIDTFEEPGSPCYHDDDTMPGFISVKDQYCDLTDGTFHQTVFVGSSKCNQSWIHHLIPSHKQVFHENDCFNGIKMISCKAGPCSSSDAEE